VMGRFVGRGATSVEKLPEITDREAEVLRLISWGHSNKDIASRLDLSVKTVEVHKTNAMKKLGMNSRIDIVRYAVLQGWMEST
jgi:DNA-binding NarL/FixJ family response regulator